MVGGTEEILSKTKAVIDFKLLDFYVFSLNVKQVFVLPLVKIESALCRKYTFLSSWFGHCSLPPADQGQMLGVFISIRKVNWSTRGLWPIHPPHCYKSPYLTHFYMPQNTQCLRKLVINCFCFSNKHSRDQDISYFIIVYAVKVPFYAHVMKQLTIETQLALIQFQ